MFVLAIVLSAVATARVLFFGVSGVETMLMLSICVVAAIIAMVAYWRGHEEH